MLEPSLALAAAVFIAAVAGTAQIKEHRPQWGLALAALVAAVYLVSVHHGALLFVLAAAIGTLAAQGRGSAARRRELVGILSVAAAAFTYRAVLSSGGLAAGILRLGEALFSLEIPGVLVLAPILITPLALASRGRALLIGGAATIFQVCTGEDIAAAAPVLAGIAILTVLLSLPAGRAAGDLELAWREAGLGWLALLALTAVLGTAMGNPAPLAAVMGRIGFGNTLAAGAILVAAAQLVVLGRFAPLTRHLVAPAAALPLLIIPLVASPARVLPYSSSLLATARELTREEPRLRIALPPRRLEQIVLTTALANAAALPAGTPVARLVVLDAHGSAAAATLRAGMDTAEWAWERPDVRATVRHPLPSWFTSARHEDAGVDFPARDFPAHRYRARVSLPPGTWTRLTLALDAALPEEITLDVAAIHVP